MAEVKKTSFEHLEAIALKIMMVDPGNLSVIGELIELTEEMVASPSVREMDILWNMSKALRRVLEKIIMGELVDDSAENFELLADCISLMQETNRLKGKPDDEILAKFCNNMNTIGHQIEKNDLTGQDEDQTGRESAKEVLQPEEPVGQGVGAASSEEPVVADFAQDADLINGFIEEALEHLEVIEVNVLDLEQHPDDSDIINNIFRPFHTIKGVSGFLNLKSINKLAHTTENLLDDVRNGVRKMDSAVIDIVLSAGDFLKSMVENVREVLNNGPEYFKEFDISEFVSSVHAVQSGEAEPSAPEPAIEPVAQPPVKQEIEPAPEEEAEASAPSVKQEIELAPEEEAEAPAPPAREKKKVPETREKEKIFKPASVPETTQTKSSKMLKFGVAGKNKVTASIKVNVDKLDVLVNAVGELVIMQSLVRQNSLIMGLNNPKLTRDFGQLTRITSELQKTAMAMRMVPIRQTFQKMIRLVRDLSKKSGKQVDLIMEGEETEIDRNMVESIYDPLVHMIRNSVDHGVQTPKEREAVGKPGKGTVWLRAYQKGGNIVIEIEDDGQGLNAEKIREKAILRGLIQESDQVSDYDLNNLIFTAGFSTVDKITDVSGRGVGMDVVKKTVEKLRGKVEIISQSGKGSLFVIRLPLTLAIIDGIVVRVGEERYIIPTTGIRESLRPEEKNLNTVYGRGETLLIRNRLLPIIRLYEIFNVEPTSTDICDAIVVVVETEGYERALMVDELLGKQEVVIKSLGGYMTNISGVAGGTILGDGRVGLILDLPGLTSAGDNTAEFIKKNAEEVVD